MKPPTTPEEYWDSLDRRREMNEPAAVPFSKPSNLNPQLSNESMGQIKNYLLTLVCACSDQHFGQEAVEWAIIEGHIQLTYHLETDLRLIMGEPGRPDTGQYDAIITAYQQVVRQNSAALCAVYAEAGLMPTEDHFTLAHPEDRTTHIQQRQLKAA